MGSLNDSFQSSNLLLFFIDFGRWLDLSQRSKGRLKSDRTMLCGSVRTGSQTDVKLYGRTDSWTNVQMDRRADLSKSDTHEFNFEACLRMGKQKRVLSNMIYLQK